MMNLISGKRLFVVLFFWALVGSFVFPLITGAQPLTHTVEKGDTLWGICEKYYGDPDLWPKLWEMNPFVTNPHLLKLGDVITLLEIEPAKKAEAPEKSAEKTAQPLPAIRGVDLSGFANLKALGYLSFSEVRPLGTIHSTDTTRLMLSPGDPVFIDSRRGRAFKAGEEFAVARVSPMLMHPLTGQNLGYVVAVQGRVVIKETLEKPFCRGEITEVYTDARVGDMLIAYDPVSACVQPISTGDKLYGSVVATKDQHGVIGQYSVVYIDGGFNHGIHRGQVFDVVRLKKISSPDFEHETLTEITDKLIGNLKKEDYLVNVWKKLREGKTIYETSVGKIMVVESRSDTATAVVLKSMGEFSNGAFVKGTSWVKPPEFLSEMPSCTVE